MASSNVVKSVEIISSTTTLEKQLGAESQHIDVPYGIADGIILNDLTGKTEGTDYNNQSLANTLKNLQYAANILDSKNFIPTGDSKIVENITYTVADDGEITINGSNPSGVSTYTIELPNVIDEACYFTIDGPSTLNNAITIAMADDQGIYIEDYFGATGSTVDGTAQLELDASSSIKYFKISVAQNGSISNLKIKPMLRLAVINDRTYAPYAKTNRELTALGSGHDIKDGGGNSYPKRKNLVFDNSVVTDDAVNDATIVTPKGQDIALGDVEGAAISQNLDTVTLIWSDPADVVVGGTTLAAWAGTTVIRKAGSAPSDVNDGTLVVTNTTRDQYASTGYTDTGLTYGTTYYYRFFPYKMAGLTKIYTNGSSVSKTIEKTVISTIPSQSGTLTYDGTSQSPTWVDYDSNQLTIGGDTSGTNADTYTATFTPNYGYKWSDNTETAKDVNWTIGQADATGSLSKNSVSLTVASPSDTVTVSGASGTISARSGNTSVATVSVSGSTVTITGVANGSTTITVTIAASSDGNYKSGTRSISVNVKFIMIFGAEWDGTAASAWTRTDAAAGFTDPSPAVNNGNGSSPFDDYMPWSGMERVEDASAGTLVKIPKFWYKWTRTGSKMKLQISNGKQTESGWHVSPAHADRGDGKGERNVVYVGAYHCASTLKSTTGVKPDGGQTRSNYRTRIHWLDSTLWQYDYAMYWTIMMLYLVEYADWNSQAKIGYGCSDNNGGIENNGLTDSMTYHTGTNASSRTTYGHVRYRYIEGLWDNVFDWCDGIYFSSGKIYCIKNPSNFSDFDNGTDIGTKATVGGVATAWTNPSTSGFEYALFPSATTVDSTYSSYDCDLYSPHTSAQVLYVGGETNQFNGYGAFHLDCSDKSNDSHPYVGSRLQKLP